MIDNVENEVRISREEPTLWAVSDLHVGQKENEQFIDLIQPQQSGDWLIVAGDIAEKTDAVLDVLRRLSLRFDTLIWVPGNHELWSGGKDTSNLRGEQRYEYLVEECRKLHVLTPEDPYPLWKGQGGPAWVVPMFLLYDYSWWPEGATSVADAKRIAYDRRAVATDEWLLSPLPYRDHAHWCHERLLTTTRRLSELSPGTSTIPTVLINHWPLLREPTRDLWLQEFALWCGTEHTSDWHLRYNAICCVYGHLHIPRSHRYNSIRFEECSLGYPREWHKRGYPQPLLRQILPDPGYLQVTATRDSDGSLEMKGMSKKRVEFSPGGKKVPDRRRLFADRLSERRDDRNNA